MTVKYMIASETGVILGILGVIIAIISLWISRKKEKTLVSVFAILICCALAINYMSVNFIARESYSKVPDVSGISLGSARTVVRGMRFVEKVATMSGEKVSEEAIVLGQSPEPFDYAQEGTEVILVVSSKENATVPEDINKKLVEEVTPEPSNSVDSLTLTIEDWDFTDKFHNEQTIPGEQGTYWITDLGAGISGTFSYSRPLSEQELENWMHGGKLYDANENEVGVEGNYPSFWSNPEGLFAVEFPKDLPHGSYTYELYQFIDGQYISDMITFTV